MRNKIKLLASENNLNSESFALQIRPDCLLLLGFVFVENKRMGRGVYGMWTQSTNEIHSRIMEIVKRLMCFL